MRPVLVVAIGGGVAGGPGLQGRGGSGARAPARSCGWLDRRRRLLIGVVLKTKEEVWAADWTDRDLGGSQGRGWRRWVRRWMGQIPRF